jgi:hypothetical protein
LATCFDSHFSHLQVLCKPRKTLITALGCRRHLLSTSVIKILVQILGKMLVIIRLRITMKSNTDHSTWVQVIGVWLQLIFVSYIPSKILYEVLFAMCAACPAHLIVLDFEDSTPFLADPVGCSLCNRLMAGIAGSNLADGVYVRLLCR